MSTLYGIGKIFCIQVVQCFTVITDILAPAKIKQRNINGEVNDDITVHGLFLVLAIAHVVAQSILTIEWQL